MIEVLIALTVIGLTAVALLGGFTTSISASAEYHNLAAEDTVLKAYVESVTYQLAEQSTNPPKFDSQCTGMTTYAPLAKTESYEGVTYALTVTDPANPIQYWVAGQGFTASGCSPYVSPFATPPQQQLLTAEISGAGVPTNSISFAISDPTFGPGSAAPPTFQSGSSDSIIGNGTTYTFAVTAAAYPTPSISMSSTNPVPPTWVTFVDNGGGSGTLFIDPAASDANVTPYTLQLVATNSLGSRSQTFSITVGSVPTFTSAQTSYTAPPATAFTTPAITASGIPTPTLSVTNTLPPGVSLNTTSGSGTVSGTLSGTNTVAAGVYIIDLEAQNTNGSAAPLAYTLTVEPPTPPSFTTTNWNDSVTYGVPMSPFSISASGAPSPTITESGALPSGVSFSAPSAGSATISGTPTDSTPTQVVQFQITVTATNAAGSASQVFTLTVGSQSQPTISSTTPSPATGRKNQNFSFQVNGTGFTFMSGVTVTFSNPNVTGTVSVQNSTTLTIACSPGNNKGTFSFTIHNPDGANAPSGAVVVTIT